MNWRAFLLGLAAVVAFGLLLRALQGQCLLTVGHTCLRVAGS